MKRIIFHTTDLDSFQWYKRIESMTKDEMVGRLLRTELPNEQMLMGTAWHAILEDPPNEIEAAIRDGFTFKVDCDCKLELPIIKEIRTEKEYQIDDVIATITGKCDGINGNRIDDHKLTFKPNPENYFTSCQWRSYLDMFNADSFRYIIYSARKRGKVVTIYDVSEMRLYRYPEMIADLTASIAELLAFVKEHAPQLIF